MPGSRGHVFVVDDNSSFLAAICRLIRIGGYEATGLGRLGVLYALLPLPAGSCVLADIILDGESGLTIPDVFLSKGETTPILFMSATDDPDMLVAADRTGSSPCLRKPFEADELFAAIETALSGRAQADEQAYTTKEDI